MNSGHGLLVGIYLFINLFHFFAKSVIGRNGDYLLPLWKSKRFARKF
jgi:hypothetical protein